MVMWRPLKVSELNWPITRRIYQIKNVYYGPPLYLNWLKITTGVCFRPSIESPSKEVLLNGFILYHFFASVGDLARFGQNRFSWPAICFLMQLFTNNQIRAFHLNPVWLWPKEHTKIILAPTDKIWCNGGQSKSILDGSNPPCIRHHVNPIARRFPPLRLLGYARGKLQK